MEIALLSLGFITLSVAVTLQAFFVRGLSKRVLDLELNQRLLP